MDYMQQQEARAKTLTTTTAVMVRKCFIAGGIVECLSDLAIKKTGELEIQALRCKLELYGWVCGHPKHG